MAGSSIDEKLQAADRLRGAVEQARRSPVNSKSIEQLPQRRPGGQPGIRAIVVGGPGHAEIQRVL